MRHDDGIPNLTPAQWRSLGRIGDVLPSLPDELMVRGRKLSVRSSKGEWWPSVKCAARALGVDYRRIGKVARGREPVIRGRTLYAA